MKDEKRKVGRPRLVEGDRPRVKDGGPVVQRVTMGHGAYVQRYVKCGPRCSRCDTTGIKFDPKRPGHGPYWYFETRRGGKTHRRYVGKQLKVIERDLSGGTIVAIQGEFTREDELCDLDGGPIFENEDGKDRPQDHT